MAILVVVFILGGEGDTAVRVSALGHFTTEMCETMLEIRESRNEVRLDYYGTPVIGQFYQCVPITRELLEKDLERAK